MEQGAGVGGGATVNEKSKVFQNTKRLCVTKAVGPEITQEAR